MAETEVARLWSHEEKNIVMVDFLPYVEVNQAESVEVEKKVLSLLDLERKCFGITKLSEGTNMTTEARNYFAQCDLTRKHTIALAAVLQNLAHRMMYNFYLKFHKPNIPMKGFSKVNEATEWLAQKGA
ncbi:MAG: hypothetical protein RIC95_11105 [Vicingaceae bacterium]